MLSILLMARQHCHDEVCLVLEAHAVIVPAGAEHRIVAYEHLALLAVVERRGQP